MEAKEVIRASLNGSWGYLNRALEGLTHEGITWTAAPHSNSIAFILWHVTKAEDYWVNCVIKRGNEIDATEGWRGKLGTRRWGYGLLRGATEGLARAEIRGPAGVCTSGT